MFGLMRHAERLPYCGACKTLGALYGQRSRVLLNHDAVFLAELLMEHAGAPEWGRAYLSFNCLSLPDRRESIPAALEFAAAATVVLAHFQILDHSDDSKAWRWQFAGKCFSSAYRRAAARLSQWQFPLRDLETILSTQSARESACRSLAEVAEPTSMSTALMFSHGARIVGRPDLADRFYSLGHRFGSMAYLLDAYEDRERDLLSGDFNPLLAFPEIAARDEILTAVAAIAADLPPALAGRLRTNIEERLGLRLRVLCGRCRKPWRRRWRDAVTLARGIRDRERGGALKGIAVLASVAAIAFLFPHQARSTDSWRQCLSIGMNLMAVSSILASSQTPPDIANPVQPAKQPAKSSSWCGGCDCDSCDCGSCCDCGGCDCG